MVVSMIDVAWRQPVLESLRWARLPFLCLWLLCPLAFGRDAGAHPAAPEAAKVLLSSPPSDVSPPSCLWTAQPDDGEELPSLSRLPAPPSPFFTTFPSLPLWAAPRRGLLPPALAPPFRAQPPGLSA